MLRYGNARYSYSKNGELMKRAVPGDTTTYSYDELGNLLTVIKQGGTRIDYLIDGENRRVGKKLNGVLQKLWLYEDGLRPVVELDTLGNVVSRFVYGSRTNVPDYMVKGGATYRIISDQLGSVRLVVNASSGAIAQSITYDPWGKDTADSSPGFQPFGFAGGIYDPDTKLVRFGARDYDASVGRWTAKDPIDFGGLNSNLYAYAGTDPINAADITGLDYLQFDGDTLSWHDDNGNQTGAYPARSGPYGKGRLPDGKYTGSRLQRTREHGMVCPGHVGWKLVLSPQFKTSRNHLDIHPDQPPSGTQGCIGVNCDAEADLYDRLKEYMKSGSGSIPVTVKYKDK